jgi:hypothetical protein
VRQGSPSPKVRLPAVGGCEPRSSSSPGRRYNETWLVARHGYRTPAQREPTNVGLIGTQWTIYSWPPE